MPITTRIEPISRDIEIIIADDLSPAARSAALARFARETIDEAAETNRRALGRVPPHETHVDGRLGAPLDSVKPEGRVLVEFHLFVDIFVAILHELRRLSPVKSGTYRDSHAFFADGVQADPANPPQGATEYTFVNLQPYSRKIEMGKMKMRVPAGVYEHAASFARRRFGNIAKIGFSYRATLGGKFFEISRIGPLLVKRDSRGRFVKGSHVRAGNQTERGLRNPAIVITP